MCGVFVILGAKIQFFKYYFYFCNQYLIAYFMKTTYLWLFAICFMCNIVVHAQEKSRMDYPRAEWSKAGTILVHRALPHLEVMSFVV